MSRAQQAIEQAARDGSGAVLLACSGGGDSVALTRMAVPALRRQGRSAAVITLDHGLRLPGGPEDAAFVVQLARALGVSCVRRRAVPATALVAEVGVQAAARQTRFRFFDAARAQMGAREVWLGHHEDDQLESIVMRGVPMPARRGCVRRPLLGVPRASLRQETAAGGWSFREDPSNVDPRFDRTHARQVVAALTPSERADLLARSQTAAVARREEQGRARSALDAALVHRGADSITLDRAALRGAPVATLLGLVLAPRRPGGRRPSWAARRRCAALIAGSSEGGSRRLDLGAGWTAEVTAQRVHLRTATAPYDAPAVRVLDDLPAARARALLARYPRLAGTRFALLDADAVGPIQVGTASQGRRLRPFGMAGTRLLRDLLAEAGVPPAARASWPVVEAADGRVLWLAGVRASAHGALRPGSSRATLLYTVAPPDRGTSPRFHS